MRRWLIVSAGVMAVMANAVAFGATRDSLAIERKIATDIRVRRFDSTAQAEHAEGRADVEAIYIQLRERRKLDIADSIGRAAVIRSASNKIHGMTIGTTTEDRFRAQWAAAPSDEAMRLGLVIEFVSSPQTIEVQGLRRTTYYLGRNSRDSAPDYWWAITFQNGVLSAIFTY